MIKFLKQPMMRKVLIALAPIYLFSIWMYGLRVVAAAVVVFVCGIATEWLFERKRQGKVSEAVLVSCALFALAFPPKTPLWILAVGIIFAVAMAKGVYGGFGRNIFNPAIAGRAFVYISFAIVLSRAYTGFGNFGIGAVDVLSSATPLAQMRAGAKVPLSSLVFGLRPGALGESMTLLIVLAGVYLILTKTASWKIIVSTLVGGAVTNLILLAVGAAKALPMESLLAGSFLFMSVFMATDPVSAPKRQQSHYVYGALIGATAVLIRTFSAFPEGTSFAILFGNTFANLIDIAVDSLVKKAPAQAKAPAKPEGGA
ncbi:MAG: RnfABCDGE type electron transport complex subunit D [Spirochaetia bacterium]|uniref:NQR2 and RnfD family protein n=1 Tax=uncultured spirochete TaxID=156406 RepID=A0A3P3XJH6_9SPIR|nr:RnfABCDGE type electron transport complex subunit D [Rectinema subterraneum]MDQ7795850.1 RnfABCDGE type electron transport complex subunit D [Spirochaetia bacterium]SLM13758.1 NQR2 and RnfD family protein [uncultured spirochete]